MNIVTRASKGSMLTHQELDSNFNQLKSGTDSAQAAADVALTTANLKATLSQVDSRLQAIVGTAPANLDTLQEIATQLANDESVASALTTITASHTAKLAEHDTAIAAAESMASSAQAAAVTAQQAAIAAQAVAESASAAGENSILAQFVGAVTPQVGVQKYYPRKEVVITNIFAYLSDNAAAAVVAQVKVNGNVVKTVTIAIGTSSINVAANITVAVGAYLTVDIVSGTGNNLALRFDH